MEEQKRKGARSTKDISPEILEQLNMGRIETANLVEWLAVDQRVLLKNLLTEIDREKYLTPTLAAVDNLKKQTVNTINEAIGAELFSLSRHYNDGELLSEISSHTSDLVRCWATYTVGRDPQSDIRRMLEKIQPFAADGHFGVREISWMAVRPTIARNLEESVQILSGWANHSDENIRRFAGESTRPRGVWCEHIEALKQQPEMASAILEPLRSDPSKYVRDSVGNWLNDAGKTQPAFVLALCDRWQKESATKETAYIIKKALRSIPQ